MQPPLQRNTELNYKRIRKIDVDPIKIAEIVHSVTKINPLENLHTRRRPYVEIRQLAMYIIREMTMLPTSKIGKIFKRDHATVLHATKTMDNAINFQKIPMLIEYHYQCVRKVKQEHEKSETIRIVRYTLEEQDMDELRTMNSELVFNVSQLLNIIDELPQGIKNIHIKDEELIHTIRQKNTELAVV